MKFLRENIANIGICSNLSPAIQEKVRISNIFSFIFGWIILLYIALFYAIRLPYLGQLGFPFGICYFFVLFLNKVRATTLSRVVLISNFISVVYVFATAIGRDSGVHFWFVPAIVIPLLLFTFNEKKIIAITFLCVLGTFLFLWISKFRYSLVNVQSLTQQQIHTLSALMVFGSFLTAFSIVLFLVLEYEKMLRMKFRTDQIIENYAFALDTSSIVAFTDIYGKIIYANNRFCEISGFRKDELIGKSHSLLNSGYHPREFFQEMWRTIASKKVWTGDICNKAKDGSLYWVATTIIPMKDVEGRLYQYVAIRHDITQRKLAEQASIHSARMASLGEMSGSIAHEINNPIGIINGKASQLLRNLKSGQIDLEKCREKIERIILETERIAKIVRGLRAFSRNGEKDPFVAVELKVLLDDVLELCSERFRNNSVTLEILEIPSVSLECRSVQISQVLSNLLNNAFDAVRDFPEKWVRVGFKVDGNKLQIRVTDSGKGIPKEISDKIMQPFFTTKEVGKGTGLGLSISKGIIEDHGGVLWLDHQAANTCFVIDLPLKQRV